jgi:hypothetical protein
MTIFDCSIDTLKALWRGLGRNADSLASEGEHTLAMSPWRPTVNHRDRPSWEQEGYSREPESSRSRPDSHGVEVPFVRNKSLSGSNIV